MGRFTQKAQAAESRHRGAVTNISLKRRVQRVAYLDKDLGVTGQSF